MWELGHKEDWAPKNWCFQTVVLEKTLESLLDSKDVKPVNPKGNQPWIFTERTYTEAPVLWPPVAKSWLIGKDIDVGRLRARGQGVAEDEMVGRHHRLNGHELAQTLGDSGGQGILACCSPRDCKESDTTEGLNNCKKRTFLWGWSLGTFQGKKKKKNPESAEEQYKNIFPRLCVGLPLNNPTCIFISMNIILVLYKL